jgi:hypothetical protein
LDHFAASEPGATFVLLAMAVHVSPLYVTASLIA